MPPSTALERRPLPPPVLVRSEVATDPVAAGPAPPRFPLIASAPEPDSTQPRSPFALALAINLALMLLLVWSSTIREARIAGEDRISFLTVLRDETSPVTLPTAAAEGGAGPVAELPPAPSVVPNLIPAPNPALARVREADAPAVPAGEGAGGRPGAAPGAGGAGGSAADRLRPRAIDPRLFGSPREAIEGPAMTDEERLQARIADRLGEWNDSVQAEAEAAARSKDWTVTGKDGKRWGISPKGIHIGDVTIPVPGGFLPPPGRREEIDKRTREWGEIQGQADRARVRDRFNERAKAIRERKDQERKEKQEQEQKKPITE